jgi:hypothetical protein
VKAVPNGKLYIQRNVTPPVYVVHLYGTAYEMGYAQGLLFKDIGPKFWPSVRQPLELLASLVFCFISFFMKY